jgi:hypothetical protein
MLTVRVTDRSGAVVGVNPLVNVLNVPTGSGATFETWVSVPRGTEPAHVTVEPTVASWME